MRPLSATPGLLHSLKRWTESRWCRLRSLQEPSAPLIRQLLIFVKGCQFGRYKGSTFTTGFPGIVLQDGRVTEDNCSSDGTCLVDENLNLRHNKLTMARTETAASSWSLWAALLRSSIAITLLLGIWSRVMMSLLRLDSPSTATVISITLSRLKIVEPSESITHSPIHSFIQVMHASCYCNCLDALLSTLI